MDYVWVLTGSDTSSGYVKYENVIVRVFYELPSVGDLKCLGIREDSALNILDDKVGHFNGVDYRLQYHDLY